MKPKIFAGLLGKVTNSNITIKNLGVVGRLVAESSYNGYQLAQIRAGGLAARISGGTFIVKNSYFTNDNEGVRATRDYRESSAIAVAGGFIGEITNKANVTITDCFVNGDIKANVHTHEVANTAISYAGGFAGRVINNSNLTIERSYAAGMVDVRARKFIDFAVPHVITTHSYGGGLLGEKDNAAVTAPNSYRCNEVLFIGTSIEHRDNTGTPLTQEEMKNTSLTPGLSSGNWKPRLTNKEWPMLASVKWTPVLDSVLEKIATTSDNTNAYQTIADAAMQLAGFDVYYDDVIKNKLLNRAEFDACETYKYDPCVFQCWLNHIAPYAIAHKKTDGKTIVVIAIRGTGLEHDRLGCVNALLTDVEFGYNCLGWNQPEHKGFYLSADAILDELMGNSNKGITGYLTDKELCKPNSNIPKDNVIFLITGHSRGASVANLLSARLYDDYSAAMPDISERVFGYCFATPPVIKTNIIDDQDNCKNIFHMDNNDDDMITLTSQNPLTGYEYECYGVPVLFKGGGGGGILAWPVEGMASAGHRPERYQKWVYMGLPTDPKKPETTKQLVP